jgi:hypothetical protein
MDNAPKVKLPNRIAVPDAENSKITALRKSNGREIPPSIVNMIM